MASAENDSRKRLSRKMMEAVQSGDVQKVKDITAKYGLSHCEDWLDGCALLHEALRFDNPRVARFLIKAGAQLTNSKKKIYILHEAVTKPVYLFSPIVELLLKKGGNVNGRNEWGNSPLHCVKTLGMARVLLDCHTGTPDVNALNNEGLTPLHLAVRSGNVRITQYLIYNGADVNFRATEEYGLYTPLHIATKFNRNSDIVGLLLQNGALVNLKCKKGTALHIACERARRNTVILLLEHGADVEATDEKGKTPIYGTRDAVIMQSLLDKGAVLKPSPGLLYTALSRQCPNLVDILIKQGCDVNERVKGLTCLHYMVSASHYTCYGANNALKIVRLLLANGADINARTEKDGATAMSRAIRYGFFEVVPILLDYGAEYQIPRSGDTLLHLCAGASRRVPAHTYRELWKTGDVNARNAFGETPLHVAVCNCHTITHVNTLLSLPDVDIDARDKDGSTALAKAAAGLCDDSVSTLLSYGADVNIPNNQGLTPVQIVEEYRATRSRSTSKVLPVSMDLRRHIAKLECAELPVSEENSLNTLDDPDYVKSCKDEVEKMKNTKIGKSCVSYYDILARSSPQVAIYTKNAAVSCVMESEESGIEKLRKYGQWIKVRYLRAKRRLELQQKAASSLGAMFQFLPDICIYMIVGYLSNEDIRTCTGSDCYPGLDD